ncbi:MAG: hypothetical protein U9N54_09820 [candidate division Zixibacteria bacterium]|nr:hypothetical protein [candidate division Zixibacteria bacterium]
MLNKDYEIDYHGIIAKTLYSGMFINILIPMAGLMICYYLDQKSYVANKAGDMANGLFYVFGLLAVLQAAYAFWMRSRAFRRPMIRHEDTFETDLATGLFKASRPIFLIISSISFYGYIYFYLTGRFKEAVFLVFMSFLIFQVVRPRIGIVKKLVKEQKVLVQKGDFLRSELMT